MKTNGASEARTHFSRLLERAANGEQVVITRHGTPMARLVPFAKPDGARTRRAISRLKTSRKGRRLDGLSWKELRDNGRC
ncbi:type II toxin-antitoxin system Phd/YefM family antitoxin [candidate division KSB1 bacterium]|nr:type II toxin-antitoxin system Phd/YefM family antitoxin [candidate division KSB1 bacterium]